MDYEKYNNALEKARVRYNEIKDTNCSEEKFLLELFPELKDSEDERIRKAIISVFTGKSSFTSKEEANKYIAWLEKQGEPIDENRLAKGVLIEVADSIIRWLDANCADGNMCLSNMECEDIENAVRDADWQKVYGYMKKKLERQCEQKPIMNVPTREVILSIWDLGNEWKELTNGSISTKYGTQLDYIQKHWHESEYYLREKQGEKKPTWSEDDERIVTALMEGFRYHQLFNPRFGEVPNAEIISWIKSLKERLS